MNFDFLVEMAWKSALISGAALAIAAALRFRPAGERSAVLRMAVGMILALPLITLLLPPRFDPAMRIKMRMIRKGCDRW